MTWPLMQISSILYVVGLLCMQRLKWHLILYVWSVFGFVFLVIHLVLLQAWHITLASFEAQHVQMLLNLTGIHLEVIDATTFLVPDGTGWSGLTVGIECSTVIELTVFAGLMLFYPKLSMQQRWMGLLVGAVCTYLLNIVRIVIIVAMVIFWGKPVVPLAHAVVGRLVYFIGIVAIYWYLLTKPTLHIVRRDIETTGRAAR